MIFIISPAKSLNFDAEINSQNYSLPEFLDESKILINDLKKLSAAEIGGLMKISPALSKLNYQRFQDFQIPFTPKNSKPAIYVFNGDVYDAIEPQNYNPAQLEFAQNHLRILSGLYGILKPLDLMQAYRLEMGTKFKNPRGKNLYEFWAEKISIALNRELENQPEKIILNLASEEYFSAINPAKINGQIIDIVFKQKHGNDYKIIGLWAKKARGLMADFIIKNQITKSSDIKNFNLNGYKFNSQNSHETSWQFFK
jgi:cytoplasmic iron level regulating protein YaaA (DUF328/UPF0246 family)